VRFDYRPGRFGIVDTGRTVQVNVPPGQGFELMGRRYELQQFHFHRPSEQRIDGRRFDMDVHLVHRSADGKLAVVAVMLQRGAALPLLQTLWGGIPLEKGEEQPLHAEVDPAQLLPQDRRYYSYMGSLSTPPCTEGVLWLAMQQPVSLSAAQIDVFARLYPMNARPVQRSAGRLIKQSN
jgi:carbonic anhydrase